MGKTNISWTDFSFNGWVGCQPISPGCGRCYAKALVERFGGDFSVRKRTSESNWKLPLKWNRFPLICDCGHSYWGEEACKHGCNLHRARVFCASMSDWLDDEAPIEWLADLLKLIHDTPNLDWQLLTKRPENWNDRMKKAASNLRETNRPLCAGMVEGWINGIPPNGVWIGTSVENQEYADKRIPELLKIPARVRFISAEPLLGAVGLRCVGRYPQFDPLVGANISDECGSPKIHWVIAGGESGKGHRPMQIEWMRSLHDQCRAAGVAWFCKQDSGPKPGMCGRIPDDLWAQEFPI